MTTTTSPSAAAQHDLGAPPCTPGSGRARFARRCAGVLVVSAAAIVAIAVPATAEASAPSACVAAPIVKQKATAEIERRQHTITELLASLGAAGDTYEVNGPQATALQSASSGLTELGQKITTTCYPDAASLKVDVEQIFLGYRIYALRVPQTKVIEAADRLGSARNELQAVADRLTPAVVGNETATAELHAMTAEIAAADATIGRPPALVGSVAAVPALTPAKDLDPTRAALQAARTDLVAARTHLGAARDHARAAIAALGAQPASRSSRP